jgi:hypothetical protein
LIAESENFSGGGPLSDPNLTFQDHIVHAGFSAFRMGLRSRLGPLTVSGSATMTACSSVFPN